MTAPFPPEAIVKVMPVSHFAAKIHQNMQWIARWSHEIARVDTENINVKKLAQLGLGDQSHCGQFIGLTASPNQTLLLAIHQRFLLEGVDYDARVTTLAADLTALRLAAVALNTFLNDNVPEARILSERVWSTVPGEKPDEEVPKTLPRTHAVLPLVVAVRDTFDEG